jgi:hypothetical protein
MENNVQTTNTPQQNAPNSVASLILGILSLLSGCYGLGLILGIIGAVLAGSGMRAYNANPGMYKGEGMLKAGKILSIIGIVFGAISLLTSLIMIISGAGFLSFYSDVLGMEFMDALDF